MHSTCLSSGGKPEKRGLCRSSGAGGQANRFGVLQIRFHRGDNNTRFHREQFNANE